jgi:alpha-ketoglutarate-dependent taurine dioxygenase
MPIIGHCRKRSLNFLWQPGDVAFWDNRSTQHRVHNDFGEARRRIHRVTVTGEIPV